jgi:hypothetical protein
VKDKREFQDRRDEDPSAEGGVFFRVAAEAAEDYEFIAGGLGAIALGAGFAAYRFLETNHSMLGTRPLSSVATAFALSVASAHFYNKSQDCRQLEASDK